jgi:predicted Zn-dependent protease
MGGFGMSRQQNLLMQYINNYDDELKLGYTLDTSDVVFLNAEGFLVSQERTLHQVQYCMDS